MAEDYTLIDHSSKGCPFLVFPGTALIKKEKIGQSYMLFVFMFVHVGMC